MLFFYCTAFELYKLFLEVIRLSGKCLDVPTLFYYKRGGYSSDVRKGIAEHLSSCQECTAEFSMIPKNECMTSLVAAETRDRERA